MNPYRENKWVTIKLKRKGRCGRCRSVIPKGAQARYNPAFGSVNHITCKFGDDR